MFGRFGRSTSRLILWALALTPLACKSGGGGSEGQAGSGSGGAGGGTTTGPIAQGQVTLLGSPCPNASGVLPNTSCIYLQVESEGNTTIDCELRITEPDPSAPFQGTVLLCSGGGGDNFYAQLNGGKQMILDLMAQGYRVLDRAWVGGWLGTSISHKQQSMRLALLLDWLFANAHQGGRFVAVGNSGGSAEIAYSLTTWDREHLFDAVVLCGGPPFTRFDYLCPPPAPEWPGICSSFPQLPEMTCGTPYCVDPSASNAETSVCEVFAFFPNGGSLAEKWEDSVAHPNADLDYPQFTTTVLIGSEDCTAWASQGLLFGALLVGPSQTLVVPGAEHTMTSTAAGRAAILQALLGS